MTQFKRWRDTYGIAFPIVCFVACCVAAGLIRHTVAVEAVGDLAAVLLSFASLAGFVVAAGFGIVWALRAKSTAERFALRGLSAAFVVAGIAFVTTSYADVSVALHALVSDGDSVPTSIVLGPGGKDVRLNGSLTEGAARQLANLLTANPQVERIHLTSDGGLVDEGDGLRKVIARYRLTTFVPDYCVSACTLAFLGGPTRLMMVGARIGFHSPFEQGLFGQTFVGDKSAERASYVAAGVAPEFVDKAFKVAPADIWTPEPEMLIAAHVATGVVDRYRFPDSNLDGIADLAGARETLLRNFPIAKGLEPAAIDTIAQTYLAAYRSGFSEGHAVDGLRSVVAAAAAKTIARGDDDTMVAFGRFLESAMEVADSDSDCVTIGRAADLVQAEEVLDDGDGKAGESVTRLLRRALETRRPNHVQASARALPIKIAAKPSEEACAVIRGIYERALRLPSHAAAEQIRALTWQSSQAGAPAVSIVAH